MSKVVIIKGSKADLEWVEKIANNLIEFKVDCVKHIASAHKVPLKCYDIIKKYEKGNVVFISIAGMSGFSDAQTFCPVLACPPYSDKFGGADFLQELPH